MEFVSLDVPSCLIISQMKKNISKKYVFDQHLLYSNLHKMPSFIASHRQTIMQITSTNSVIPNLLQPNHYKYTTVLANTWKRMTQHPCTYMIVTGTAGTGKSYLINC